MRLICPKCDTEYEVPDAAFAGRSRKVRCERCEHSWRAGGPDAPVEPTSPLPQAAPAPVPPPAMPPQPLPRVAEEPAGPIYSEEPLAWSEEAISSDRTLRIPPGAVQRRFGQPVDAAAQAEVMAAVGQEQQLGPPPLPEYRVPDEPFPPPPGIGDTLPAFLTAEHGNESPMVSEPESNDRFAELVYAARNKAIEYEPEPPPPRPPVRTSNKPLFFTLLILCIVAFVLVEHSNVVAFFPGTRGFFAKLGLK